ncbi:MAG: hypothetical protein ACRCYR_16365 [Phycicoccus sp.]
MLLDIVYAAAFVAGLLTAADPVAWFVVAVIAAVRVLALARRRTNHPWWERAASGEARTSPTDVAPVGS